MIRRIVETCCATGALSLKLVGGPRAKPVISGLGCKQGYAGVLLGLVGARQGQGCEQVLFCDPGPWGAAWPVLASRGDEVAAVLRGWQGREPRELWDWCKDQGWGEMTEPEEVAVWTSLPCATHGRSPLHILTGNPAARVSAVARWLVAAGWAWKAGQPESGFNAITSGERPNLSKIGNWATFGAETIDKIASRILRLPVPLLVYHGSALDIAPFADTTGEDLVYCDPPYLGTTSYQHTVYAEDLKPRLREWSEAGAVVLISECRPLADLMGPGWVSVRIDSERRGVKRTFSKQKQEWITMNRPPVIVPGRQVGMFG